MDRSFKMPQYPKKIFKGYDGAMKRSKRGPPKLSWPEKQMEKYLQGDGDAPILVPQPLADNGELGKTQNKRAETVRRGKRKARKAKHRAGFLKEMYDDYLEADLLYDWPDTDSDENAADIKSKIFDKDTTERRTKLSDEARAEIKVKLPDVHHVCMDEEEDEDDMGGILGVFAEGQEEVCFSQLILAGIC